MHAVWLSASVKYYYLGSVRESDVLLLSAVKFFMLFTIFIWFFTSSIVNTTYINVEII